MARVTQELQLVAMKAVARICEQVHKRNGGRDGQQDRKIDAREIPALPGSRIVMSV
jgi:hypothetical protein